MRVRHKRPLACRILLAVLLLVIIVCAAAGGIWFSAMHSLGKHAVCGTDSGYETDGCVLEDTVLYHGKTYRRNEKISTILCMGLDTENDMKSAGGVIGSGAQSDANFLVVIDREQKKLRIVAIPRDTMTDLETFYMTGEPLGLLQDHLALQYAFGDGGTKSCELVERAVSRLFYNLPIDAYVTFSLNSIESLNGMAGGVTVFLEQDFENYHAGETVTLNNEQAYRFVRWRDCDEAYSAQYRLQRQKEYLTAFVEKVIGETRADLRTPFRMYAGISDSVLTNLSRTQILSLALTGISCGFSEESLQVVPGEQVMGDYYEEFHVDEEQFYEMILDLFYIGEDS